MTKLLFPLLLALSVVILSVPNPSCAAGKNILILHSYYQTSEWTDNIMQGMMSVLKQSDLEIEIHVEYMDTGRYPPGSMYGSLESLCRAKFKNISFDVILLSDDDALNFLLPRRESLFPGVPIVFCGINDFRKEQLQGQTEITGINQDVDVKETIEFTLQIMPGIKKLLVVNDRSRAGLAVRTKYEQAIAALRYETPTFEFMDDFTLAELQTRLTGLSQDSAVLVLNFHQTREGRQFTPKKYGGFIVDGCNVPIFKLWGPLGDGALGGVLVSRSTQGVLAAEYALRILKGEPVSLLPVVMKSPNLPMADYRQLKRFGISKKALPPNTLIINEPKSVFYLYRYEILGSVLVFAALIAVIIALFANIIVRRKAENALRENEARHRSILETAMDGICISDKQGRLLEVNETYCRMSGYNLEELLAMHISDLEAIATADDVAATIQNITDGGERRFETLHRRKDGTLFDVEVCAQYQPAENGRHVCFIRDITDRKQAERDRLANLKYFESMDRVNRALNIKGTDLEDMVGDVFDIVLSVFGCDRAFLIHPCDPEAPFWQVLIERTRPEYPPVPVQGEKIPMNSGTAESFREILNATHPVSLYPESGVALSGDKYERYGFLSMLATALHPRTGKPWIFGLNQCAYARKWTPDEEKLFQEIGRRLLDSLTSLLMFRDMQKNEEFLDTLVENIPNMIFVKDPETLKFLRINKAAEQHSGYSREEMVGKTIYDFHPKEAADRLVALDRKVTDTKEIVDIPEVAVRNRNNEERFLHTKMIPILDNTGKLKYQLNISEDITDRKKLEEQLRQSQKMDSIGRLAGGVAHDFNNMLGVIIGHTELSLEQLDPVQPLYGTLQSIRKAAERSAALTRQLLGFARKQTVSPLELDLNETIDGTLKMLRRLIGEDIDLAWLPGPGQMSVKVDPSQIDQILTNLCINARDAISGVGKLIIETHATSFDEAYCADHPGTSPGDYIVLAVSDNGSGMDHETVNKVFEPFFTTKETGKGTGLGLATVYGIVKQNNGFINVYSEPGHGTTFKIYLPRHVIANETPRIKSALAAEAPRGHETILLVEDEPEILDMTKLMLERYGYRVLAVSTPDEAIQTARANTDAIQMLITDVVMPGMNGLDLSKKISAICPGLRQLFMSGYASNFIAQRGILDEGVNYIQKPFSPQELSTQVRRALDDK